MTITRLEAECVGPGIMPQPPGVSISILAAETHLENWSTWSRHSSGLLGFEA